VKRVWSGPRGTIVAVVVFLVGLGFGPPTAAAVPRIDFTPANNSIVRPNVPFLFAIQITYDTTGQFNRDAVFIKVNGTDYTRELVAAIVSGQVVTTTSGSVTTLTVPAIPLAEGQYLVEVRVVSSSGTGNALWSITAVESRLSEDQRALIAERGGNPDYILITFNTNPLRVEENWTYISTPATEYAFYDGTRSDGDKLLNLQAGVTRRPPKLDPARFSRTSTLQQINGFFGMQGNQISAGPITTFAWPGFGLLATFQNGALYDVKTVDIR
jgi:hypothetical protein